jgi:predicted 2-oxoglutarate/Fe(II)-dependent dioxygenase YbiX
MNSIEEISEKIKNFYTTDQQTWSSVEELADGIFVFHDVIPKKTISILEDVIQDSSNNYDFMEAMVGYGMKMPEYRDCVDFKYKRSDIESDNSMSGMILKKLWDSVYFKALPAVQSYCKLFNIGELRYWEAMNFVKYGPGQHFMEHHDHGYSYNCVVSLVGYPNDNYEGGEINFRLQNLTVKPRAGDLFVFPSNFMYPHRAMPVKSGTKYSIVTMLDYSDKYHRPEFYQETNS